MQLSFRYDMRRMRTRGGSNNWLWYKIIVPQKGVLHLFLIQQANIEFSMCQGTMEATEILKIWSLPSKMHRLAEKEAQMKIQVFEKCGILWVQS